MPGVDFEPTFRVFEDGGTRLTSNAITIIKWSRMEHTGHVARLVKMKSVYTIIVGHSEGKRPHGEY